MSKRISYDELAYRYMKEVEGKADALQMYNESQELLRLVQAALSKGKTTTAKALIDQHLDWR